MSETTKIMEPEAGIKKLDSLKGWRKEKVSNSLPEVFSSIQVPKSGSFWKKLLAFSGPGLMVAVGYMDPGNWATDIAGGARFGYTLLSVILISNFFAIILQYLALKLGIATERDLAQACRDHYNPTVSFCLWVLCEIAIAACDLAEVIGSALALNLLFHIPLAVGVAITALDVLVILFFQYKGFRLIESIVASLIFVILACFTYEILASHPDLIPILSGLIPRQQIVFNPSMLYIAISILGATVIPHNLYLHSSIVQTRAYERNETGKKMAIKFAAIDSFSQMVQISLIAFQLDRVKSRVDRLRDLKKVISASIAEVLPLLLAPTKRVSLFEKSIRQHFSFRKLRISTKSIFMIALSLVKRCSWMSIRPVFLLAECKTSFIARAISKDNTNDFGHY